MSDGVIAETGPGEARAGQPRFWLLAAAIFAVLFALYWFVLRAVYVPVLVDLEPQDAVEIAKVLDDKKLTYRLEDQGQTIAVVSDQTDRARIELAGSELPAKGQIGFELFNQSDMGLTEFAQKINFQRALQGELARTILLLDGIQTVRVHLGLPERGLFRGEQDPAKASITLVLKPGKSVSAATVSGIQRLVAGAIPDLSPDAVAVLDGTGRLISAVPDIAAAPPATSDAVIGDARQRLRTAIARAHPNLDFDVSLSLHYLTPQRPDAPAGQAVQAMPSARGSPDFTYAVRITTPTVIDAGLRSDIDRLSRETLGIESARGDGLVFLTGAPPPEAVKPPPASDLIVARAVPQPSARHGFDWQIWWPFALAGAAGLIGLALWHDRRRARVRREAELSSFAEALRLRLEAEG
ncbi:MAG: flagellar basal-body MS-ring/collar protein FliF [Novosphingobium sp.]|uniref:flagellar basal-body MS-ring/collar protein FliF n=1 Tax=Novosphingobium sp. TaxID=1874826 RepID=UPI0032B85289